LPAVEQFGEGIFIKFSPTAVETWLARPEVAARERQLKAGHRKWQNARQGKVKFPTMPYVLLHSLSHAIMLEIALESGYPASSLKERVYALEETNGTQTTRRLGLLIYTASTGAQGTLGGLVGLATQIIETIEHALDRVVICSNDPICADHDPASGNDDRHLHGAACHSCLLVAETSCEKRNEYLDRALLIDTMATNGARFVLTDKGLPR
jgi:Domain of unknown function (DUF1998)